MEASAFIKKLKKDKADRERQYKMINEAKDAAFLTKLQETVANRKKVEEMKNKDREMRYKMMMRRLDD